MLKTIRLFLILILLLSPASQNYLAFAKNPPATIFLGNRELGPGVKFIERDQILYINHLLLDEIFKTQTQWEIHQGLLKINFAHFEIEFQPDHSLLTINEKKYELKATPFEQADNLWLPLEFFEILGIAASSRKEAPLKLTWTESYLLDQDLIQYQGRPALELILTGSADFKNFLLAKPDRLVCQFPATKIHPANLVKLSNLRSSLVKKVRFNEDETGLLTLVFDLSTSTGYQVVPDPDIPERILIVFDYFLEELSLFRQGTETKVNIKTSAPADFKVVQDDSRSLIVDFYNAVLKIRKKTIPGDGETIKEVSVEQIEANTVRLTLTRLNDEELFLTPSRDNPNLLQIRKVQLITGITWTSSSQGNQLVVTGDGELLTEVHKTPKPKRILVDLDYARFDPNLTIPELTGDQGKAIHLNTISSTRVQLEIDLNYFLGYISELSPTKNQLRIVFPNSPLLNKTFVIDPGHGGLDNGASGKKGTLEKELNLEVSLRLKDLLEEAGANVVLTRFEDTFISLYERSFLANYLMADIFISIHTNSHPKPQIEGIEVFYYPNHSQARPIATKILDAMAGRTGLKKLAVKTNNFVVIRETQMPGVLLELGFLSNAQEELRLRSDEYKNNAAEGIFQGILDFYN